MMFVVKGTVAELLDFGFRIVSEQGESLIVETHAMRLDPHLQPGDRVSVNGGPSPYGTFGSSSVWKLLPSGETQEIPINQYYPPMEKNYGVVRSVLLAVIIGVVVATLVSSVLKIRWLSFLASFVLTAALLIAIEKRFAKRSAEKYKLLKREIDIKRAAVDDARKKSVQSGVDFRSIHRVS
jgi:hypothetical protein